MTTTPDEPLNDDDMETTAGAGSDRPTGDADGTDGDTTDTVDGDSGDATALTETTTDTVDGDSGDADGTDA
jgi:hypothetical protein